MEKGSLKKVVQEDRGAVSIELIGSIPILLIALLIAGQIALAGHAFWSAGIAARAGARAVLTGREPRAAAEHALPGPLRAGMKVSQSDGIEVGVRIPELLPGLPEAFVYGSASYGES
ncbi:MAG: hypothetical protein WBP55_08480 [Solirubrobacterales bacterium]